jgi:hypothetical protein
MTKRVEGRVPHAAGENNQSAGVPQPQQIMSYFDTIVLWLDRKLEYPVRQRLERMCGSLRHEERRPRWRPTLVQRLQLHQPSTDALRFLSRLLSKRRIYHEINCVDVAIDYVFRTTQETLRFHKFLDVHFVKRWHRKHRLSYFRTTRYTAQRRWVRNNVALYSDKPSRFTGDPCAHLEWRSRLKSAVRSIGVSNLSDLISFDHRGFWEKRMILERIDLPTLGRQFKRQPKAKKSNVRQFGRLIYDADAAVGRVVAQNALTEF